MVLFNYNFFNRALLDTYKEEEIINDAHVGLKFKFGSVGYREFSNYYTNGDWFGHKIVALPLAAWSLCIQTTYHLACALLDGIPSLCAGKADLLKEQMFSCVRDLQEVVGRIISIFHHAFGLYLIEEAQFHKQYYQYSSNSSDYQDLVKRYVKNHESKHFSKKLELLSANVFKKIFPDLNSVDYACIPDKHLNNIEYNKLSQSQFSRLFDHRELDLLSPSNLTTILQQFGTSELLTRIHRSIINTIDFNSLSSYKLKNIFNGIYGSSISNVLAKLNILNLKIILDKLDSPVYYSSIPSVHLKNLNFRLFNPLQLRQIFPLSFSHAALESKFKDLSPSNMNYILDNLCEPKYFFYVPDKFIPSLDYHKMTRQELSFLFHGARRENVKKLRAKDLIEVFDLLSDSVKNCFSAEQLRHPEVKRLYDQFLQKSNRFNYFDFDSSSGSNSTSNINWKDFLSYFNLGTSQPNSPSEENYQPRSHLFSSFIDPHQKHYEALGLSVGANEDEIKRAYRNLILLYHPDKQKKMPHETCDAYQKRCGVIEEKCKNINEAYGILTKKI